MIKRPQKIRMIKTEDIYPNPYQVRRRFDEKSLEKLSESIKENGIISPVLLRSSNVGYEIICGQRRVRAAIMAGIREIPSIVINAGDASCAQLSMIENVHRENLNYIEEAEGYYNLLCYHNVKKDKLVKKMALDKSFVADKIKLLSLGEQVRYMLEKLNFTEKFAHVLLKIHEEEGQLSVLEKADEENTSYRDLCALVREEIQTMRERSKPRKRIFSEHQTRIFSNTIDKTIEMLIRDGADITTKRKENEEYTEINIKIRKKQI